MHDVINLYLPDIFDVMHGESEENPRKPDPTGLLRTISELDSTPAQTVYVGDSGTDVAVSRNAGVFSLGAAWGYHGAAGLRKAGADAVIEDPRELLRFAPEYDYTG